MSGRPRASARTRRWLGSIIGTVAVGIAAIAVPAPTRPPAEAAPGPGRRYVDLVFPGATMTSNVTFATVPALVTGAPVALRVDVFQPGTAPGDDDTLARPAILWVHGGGFAFGDRSAMHSMARDYARRGFVTVAVQYRLDAANPCQQTFAGSVERCAASVVAAMHDVQGAVRWLRGNAASYRVDPDRIAVAGFSAGGITALHVAQRWHTPGEVGEHDHLDARVQAALAVSGCNYEPGTVGAGDAPILLAHARYDTLVPYDCALDVAARARAVGVAAQTLLWPTSGTHGSALYTERQREIDAAWTAFLVEHLDLGGRPSAGSITRIRGLPGRSAIVALAATETAGAGFLHVVDCDTTPGATANLNLDRSGQTRSGLAVIRFAADGTACVYTHAAAHLVVDLQGYVTPSALDDVSPDVRLLDTRTAGGRPADGTLREFRGRAGSWAVLSVVATETTGPGFVQVLSCGTTPGGTANVNVDGPGETVSNLAVVRFGPDGRSCVFTQRAAHLVVDLQAYLDDDAIDVTASGANATRLLDTRQRGARPAAGTTHEITGPPGRTALLSIAATETAGGGYVQVLPCGSTPGSSANLTVDAPGQTRNNLATVRFGIDGRACVYVSTSSHLVIDRQAVMADGAIDDVAPDERLVDTRLDT